MNVRGGPPWPPAFLLWDAPAFVQGAKNLLPAYRTDQVPGVAPPTTPYSFCLPKMSKQQKGTPSPVPLRGFPAHGRRLAGGQKLAALKHLSAFFAKRPPRSGCGDKGNHDTKIPISGRGGPMCPPDLSFRLNSPPCLRRTHEPKGLGVVGLARQPVESTAKLSACNVGLCSQSPAKC
jgi:hypothetical protein